MLGDVVVDTCMWVDFFNRPRSRAKRAVDALIDSDRAVVVGPVVAEVMQGCASRRQAEWVASMLTGLRGYAITDDLWRQAGIQGLDLRRRGSALPLSDLVIAAAALHHDAEVYSVDPHFRRMPRLRLFAP